MHRPILVLCLPGYRVFYLHTMNFLFNCVEKGTCLKAQIPVCWWAATAASALVVYSFAEWPRVWVFCLSAGDCRPLHSLCFYLVKPIPTQFSGLDSIFLLLTSLPWPPDVKGHVMGPFWIPNSLFTRCVLMPRHQFACLPSVLSVRPVWSSHSTGSQCR